ncbi:hypothetical protein [Legionella shakespearei]|uniref:Cyanophycin synthetase n=1 Tax=Legionella shakespearei DSM 23087 TaxID=1122169 RepID=A0A0W0YKN3_9GAMM|nr:hypothetical protein [Legionella shakespearei]KTD57426.1 cyanophycin synthetase [Legionella shakespearei DSM 23087]
MFDTSMFSFNFSLLLKYIADRGIELNLLPNTDIVVAQKEAHIEYLVNYQTSITPSNSYIILDDKFYSKKLMEYQGYSVPKARVFDHNGIEEALSFAGQIGYPVVLKKTNGSQGFFVYPNLQTEHELKTAFEDILKSEIQCNIMVEQHFDGDDYRFLIINGVEEPFIVRRTAPRVVGDGVSTIQSLIEKENHRRLNPRSTCLTEIFIQDTDGLRALNHQQLTLDSIPEKDRVVLLRYNANVTWGAQCEALDTNSIHPSYVELAKSIHKLFPENGFTSVDLLIKDPVTPCSPDSYIFCEFNTGPGFSLHHMPGIGAPQNVLDPIVDLLFPETKCTNE